MAVELAEESKALIALRRAVDKALDSSVTISSRCSPFWKAVPARSVRQLVTVDDYSTS
ncbi:hypothetical protein [Spiribacter vilamensis]|uniref:Uncharacterized protein n=1 Tax=Spiribacter vilamensis TaxID=531306 RepID=A0A4Q8D0D8_9GAMM|nr:hypothetical protein [Spiribacter vilamensis]RZU98734.1 hypothetical protein EV698_0995 [Spiribacter vilamensis]